MPKAYVLLLAVSGGLMASSVSRAQDFARHTFEISALGRQTANETNYVYGGPRGPVLVIHQQLFGGAVAGYSFALSPRFALEARAGYLFGRQIQVPQNGGEQVLAHAGIRATVPIGHSRYAFIARIAPGVSSFSSGLRSQDFTLVFSPSPSGVISYASVPHYGRITHFSLEEGVGLTARLSSRTSLHFDVSHEVLLQGDRRQTLPASSYASVVEDASVEDHSLVAVGLSRSFGRGFRESPQPRIEEESEPVPPNELIVSYALQPTINLSQYDLGLPSGVAITGSHFLRRWLALDSSIILLGGGDSPSYQDGGGQLQFFSGIKFGLQRSRYGLYGKIRPGLIRFSKAYQNVPLTPPPTDIVDQFGGDAGAVFELYPTRHMVVRFDSGETFIQYGAVTPVSGYGYGTNYAPARDTSAPQFLVGVGWRF